MNCGSWSALPENYGKVGRLGALQDFGIGIGGIEANPNFLSFLTLDGNTIIISAYAAGMISYIYERNVTEGWKSLKNFTASLAPFLRILPPERKRSFRSDKAWITVMAETYEQVHAENPGI